MDTGLGPIIIATRVSILTAQKQAPALAARGHNRCMLASVCMTFNVWLIIVVYKYIIILQNIYILNALMFMNKYWTVTKNISDLF